MFSIYELDAHVWVTVIAYSAGRFAMNVLGLVILIEAGCTKLFVAYLGASIATAFVYKLKQYK